MSIISRYLANYILGNFYGVFLILLIMIFGNQLFLVVKDSLNIGLFSNEITYFIFLKVLRDLPEILIISFLGGLVVSLIKLTQHSEMTILSSSGVGPFVIFKSLKILIIFATLIIFIGSNFITPWSKNELAKIKDNANKRPDYIFLNENQFQNFNQNIFYSSEIKNNKENQELLNVFIYSNSNNQIRIISSKSGVKYIDKTSGAVFLILFNGEIFDLDNFKNIKSSSSFDKFKMKLFDKEENAESGVISIGSADRMKLSNLINLNTTSSKSEIFYRFSLPILFLLTVLFSLIVNRINTRSGKGYLVIAIFTFFIIYFNAVLTIKTLISDNSINFLLAFIVLHFLFIGIITTYFFLKEQH